MLEYCAAMSQRASGEGPAQVPEEYCGKSRVTDVLENRGLAFPAGESDLAYPVKPAAVLNRFA
jgi:hypothetical protein